MEWKLKKHYRLTALLILGCCLVAEVPKNYPPICLTTCQVDLIPLPSAFCLPADLISIDYYPLPLLLLLRSRPEEGRSARSSYPVSDWTGMKLVFSLAWIGFILAQRVVHLPWTDGLGR
ncbi:hypothetical protein V6N13_108456 [Hibiscus sabdariffa]|uniref:Uncharacterized protein n=1 Tax=Hibiscus sabdariffa TaxID=183260 RepID=A0ABR2ST60_9ROSI